MKRVCKAHTDPFLKKFGMTVPEAHPTPFGYRVLVMPYAGPEKTKGGIILADPTREVNQHGSCVAYVVQLGPDAYEDMDKFPNGPWCEAGDWVCIGKFAGTRLDVNGVEMRMFNDDEFLGGAPDPEAIKRFTL